MNDGRGHRNDDAAPPGLASGRNWSAVPIDGEPLVWTLDPDGGFVQGPLDLGFLRGQKLSLVLEPGQVALLIRDDDVRAVYLDGTHTLDIGTGQRQVSPACRLVFLAAEAGLHLKWSAAAPLQLGPAPEQALIGACHLQIGGPQAFHDAFLAGAGAPDDPFLQGLIEQIVRSLLDDLLGGHGELAPSYAGLQAHLARLGPDDLVDDLELYGLTCRHLAVYTACPPVDEGVSTRTATPSVDDRQMSGHFDGVGHN